MRFLLLILCLGLAGCGGSPVAKERARVEAAGWTFHEVVGKERSNVEPFTWLEAATARKLTVGIQDEGRRVERVYDQDQWLYHASLFSQSSGESFALVFRKPKK